MTDDMMTFLGEEGDKKAKVPNEGRNVWRILITDDEQDVHSATTFALRNTKILGRRLEFLHAKSAEEALTVLRENDDIAVIILDVVMETPNAGLDLVAKIRKDLNNTHSRIILRTGQPNQAPEIEVIRDYDINDYKLKSELTQNKLYASLTTAVRSYRQIKTIESSIKGLDLIVHASADLMSKNGIHEFAQGVIVQIAGLLGIEPEGLICVRRMDRNGKSEATVIAAAGHYCLLIDHPLADLNEPIERKMLTESLDNRCNVFGEKGVALYLGSSERGDMSCYIESTLAIKEVDKGLLELFCSNISICADNIELLEKLHSFAFVDSLVNLPNRNALGERLEHVISADDVEDYALAAIDIDNFSEINAALGQEYSDGLLKVVANKLVDAFPSPAVVARIAGDTFAVLAHKALLSDQNILDIFATPIIVGDESQQISMTSGRVTLNAEDKDAASVLKNASIVLKNAKNRHRGEVVEFHQGMLIQAQQRLGLLRDLRAAFDSGALFLVFQPKFDLQNNTISGFEALLRWLDEDGHVIFPDSFIEIAEQSGLIIRIGEWVLRKAIEGMQSIHEKGWRDVHISVNMSAVQLHHPDLLKMLKAILNETGADARYIDLEITESMGLTDSEEMLEKLNAIKQLGFSLSIDDFGTGFSSLSYLQKLPVDRLKIDQSFVQTSSESGGREIIEMIVQLGSTLDLRVIAEGVEQHSELELMKKLQCDEVQGFLYSKPMVMNELGEWMDKNKERYKN